MYRKLLLSIILIPSYYFAFAQKEISRQHLLWTRYDLNISFTPKWSIQQELEERSYFFPWKQHQFIARTNLHFKFIPNWTSSLGFSYFLQSSPQDPFIKEIDNKVELRPQIGLSNNFQLNDKLSLQNRYWSEFRIFEESKGHFAYGNVRLRYQIKLNYQVLKKLQLGVFNEVHINIGKKIIYNVFDQNRIGALINYNPIKNLGIELAYFNWYQQRASGYQFYSRHILRISIHHNISLIKK
ncbi:MAG: DUF2490 domain-containing protein [Chitinophagales bacterium]|nr:DUF2490 domain-containing protein [Bacteroidota bacterium]MCB9256025.1 DUF2490 domain-containing protein [Chitinophagales bacterium]